MKSEGTVEYNSLSWVKKQLDTVLHDAQTSLSDYIEDSGNTSALEQCIEHLRLVYGTLQMVEVYGAAMLAEEMELTAKAELDGLIEKPEDVYDVLMRAMLQLPDYLEGLQAGNQDAPITLMPLMNDMRAARKEKLLSESVLFLPNVDSVEIEELNLDVAAIEPGHLADEAKRLRTHYQLGLLDLLRNNKPDAGLKRMRAVIEALQKVTADVTVKRFWMVVSSLLESISDDEALQHNISVKGLLGGIDRQIKLLVEIGETEFIDQYSQEILKNSLYYVGTSQASGSRINKVKQAYRLDELLVDDSSVTDLNASMGGVNAELFDAVSQGIREDLASVKDMLEIFMQSSDKDVEQIASVVEQIERIGDTYGMLGFGAIRQKILNQRDEVEKIVSGDVEATEERVMDVAATLLEAESKLDDYIAGKSGAAGSDDEDQVVPNAEYRKVLATVVEQGQQNFMDAKEAILVYAAGSGKPGQLDDVMQNLEEVRGACMMLSADRVGKMITDLREYVHVALQLHDRQLEMDEQDTLADAVTAIEYYFEAMVEGRPGVDRGLQAGEQALKVLAGVVGEYEGVEPPVKEIIEEDSEVVSEIPAAAPPAAAPPDGATSESISVADTVVPDQYEEYEILADDADEEIVEIFIEEAVEVLGSLHEYQPQWKADHNNEEALTVVRRNFHTLKGSGRLIGAALIGEFSWKIESLLNRVIDKKIEATDELMSLMDEVLAVLPQLIEQLRGNREPIPNIYQLMVVADNLAEGRASGAVITENKVESNKVSAESKEESPAPELEINSSENEVFEISGDISDEDEMLLDALNGTDSEEEISLEMSGDGDEISLEMATESADDELLLDVINSTDSEEEISLEMSGDGDEISLEMATESADDELLLDVINSTDSEEEISLEMSGDGDEISLEMATEPADDELLLDVINSTDSEEEISLEMSGDGDEISLEMATESADDELLLDVINSTDSEEEISLEMSGDGDEISLEMATESADDELLLDMSVADQDIIETSDVDENDFVIEIDESAALDGVEEISGLDMDPMLFQIYYDESVGHLQTLKEQIARHESGIQALEVNNDLIRALHTLFGSARTAEIEAIAEISGSMEKYVVARGDAEESLIPDNEVGLITEVARNVELMLEELKAGKMPELNKTLLDNINKSVQHELKSQLQQSAPLDEVHEQEVSDRTEITEALRPEQDEILYSYGEVDDDLIDIFLEEAEELLEDCENTLAKLNENEDDADSINELQRHMHTLKGGARMAALVPVGDLTHELESMVVTLSENKIEASKALFNILHESLDTINSMLVMVKQREPLKTTNDLINRIKAIMRGEPVEQRLVERLDLEVEDLRPDEVEEVAPDEAEKVTPDEVVSLDVPEVVPEAVIQPASGDVVEDPHRRKSDLEKDKPHWGERATDVNFKDSQEQVRVRADLLNNLVNYAGEVNIHHARMGKQITDIGFNLKELDQTVVRLKEQLRKLEIETEIQIRSSYEKEADDYDENFDPLEMDRYSTLQQLARSLSETASDVDSIKDILAEIAVDSETLLLQESRISTDLQEGLMRTRMVRFGGMSTRLRRIVRQTSRELGKEVEVEITGEEQEVDRTILDRVVAPLEHMLRNAVAHGIESAKDRLAAGKPEVGHIKIIVDRQGTDVIFRVEDDGAGISADAIRKKAIKQGLLEKDNHLTDHDVLQFILKSGFSTAEEITQVAGRGVGMDVVDSEIKQLGGVLEIDTERGRGSIFRVRLPLTLAINQALLVEAGDDVYAVPLASIEGVIRITGTELQGFYDSGDLEYEFNGIDYELKHLGSMLTGQQADYADQGQLFPVLLVHVGDQHFALHVDDLLGRREIVIKPVGVQISTVRGIAGATILADGRVILILEMSSLVMGDSLFKEIVTEEAEEVIGDVEPTIMVVDDSITIRKVTARILERHGMKVILATDGVDATNKLQEEVPDLMLLDIEMPKMDGFELATYMRNEDKLKDVPIIMITSRTGAKHKERAKSIGVQQYLGKPFQEDDLMKNIDIQLKLAR